MVSVSAIQLTSSPSVTDNLLEVEYQLSKLSIKDDHIVVLPECCLFFGGDENQPLQLARQHHKDDLLREQLANLAQSFGVYLVAGSIPIYQPQSNKFTNSCCVFSPQGEQIGRYDKIHLFDVNVADNVGGYQESQFTQPGNKTCIVTVGGFKLGLSICYDLRFPELYRQLTLAGADIIAVPSAFTTLTGKAHWQTLLQARAIENQVYIVAAAQEGKHQNNRQTWGHSMIINPWGEIISGLAQGQGIISAEICRDDIVKVRSAMPVADHNQFITKLKFYE
jgi:predicted amidohydrolase